LSLFLLGAASSINRSVPWRPCLPAAVHPKPLLGMLANTALDGLGKQRGVADGVGFGIASLDQVERWSERDLVLANGGVPDGECRYNCRSGLQGDAREATGGAGGNAEKIHEDSLRRGHIGVHQDADGLTSTHRAQQ